MVLSLPEVSPNRASVLARNDSAETNPGAFSLFHEKQLRELVDLAHEHGVYISTVRVSWTNKISAFESILLTPGSIFQGGWAEHLLTHPDPNMVFDRYLKKCKDLG